MTRHFTQPSPRAVHVREECMRDDPKEVRRFSIFSGIKRSEMKVNFSFTVAHNCHVKFKFSHQKKFPTSKSNLPRQTQIRHSKSKIVTAKTNSPHQKQICHSKNKFLTSKTNLSHQNQKQRLNGQRSMNESYLQFSLGLHPTAILFLHMVPTATFVPIKLRKR